MTEFSRRSFVSAAAGAVAVMATPFAAIADTPSQTTQGQTMKNKKFTPANSAIVLVDHQKMTMEWIYSQDRKTVENNLRMLARIGAEVNVPLLITTTLEDQVGMTWEGIQQAAQNSSRAASSVAAR